jgi:hypothetical protein
MNGDRKIDRFPRVLLLAPFIFVAHFLEESPRFVEWFNAHVARHITSGLFWRVNISALAILLYVPYYSWEFMEAVKSERVKITELVVATVLGSTIMLIHGYLILFRESRLF